MTMVSPVDSNLLTLGHQALTQLRVIVNFAVENDRVTGHWVHHGLRAGGRKVEDGKPAVGQQSAPAAGVRLGHPNAVGVRSPVRHGVVHPLQCGAVALAQPPYNSGYATHLSFRLPGGNCLW